METLFAALGLLLAGSIASLLCGRRAWPATIIGVGTACVAGGLGLYAAIQALASGQTVTYSRPWSVPGGSLSFAIDPLSAWFLLPVFGLTAIAAVHGGAALWPERLKYNLGSVWACYGLQTASMAVAVLARNVVLFLMAWEIMALASYFLVVLDDEDESVQKAGRLYLIAMHLGAAFLFAMFLLLGRASGSLDFAAIAAGPAPSQRLADLLFVLGLIGFGTKAGLMPMHVWVPEAHPRAPGFVLAVKSCCIVKMGVYGLIRLLTMLPEPQAWWGWSLITLGAISGLWGILHALTQRDMNKLLAYSTVENVGIIALGLGAGVVGMAGHSLIVAVLGFAGALLHVLNHSLMKGALFLSAGSVIRAVGTREIDRLGGLARRMPWVAVSLVVGAVAIVGLPPLNGFMSEFLIYLSAFRNDETLSTEFAIPAVVTVASLALIGGLAAIAFCKLVGITLLGEPRSESAENARQPSGWMVAPPLLLVFGCAVVAALAPQLVRTVAPLGASVAHLPADRVPVEVEQLASLLARIIRVAGTGILVFLVLAAVRWVLLSRREIGRAGTWDCGYAQPTARMQYTGSSLVGPVVVVFAEMLHIRSRVEGARGLFPAAGSVQTDPADVCLDDIYTPAFGIAGRLLKRLNWIQQGTTQVYVLYIALTLVALLVWQLGPR
jgi:formate hydrogenlyase subunit 3/multisubunit Na+/H+ antiporter MnhD subunit